MSAEEFLAAALATDAGQAGSVLTAEVKVLPERHGLKPLISRKFLSNRIATRGSRTQKYLTSLTHPLIFQNAPSDFNCFLLMFVILIVFYLI
jgi:hypothetical protein